MQDHWSVYLDLLQTSRHCGRSHQTPVGLTSGRHSRPGRHDIWPHPTGPLLQTGV